MTKPFFKTIMTLSSQIYLKNKLTKPKIFQRKQKRKGVIEIVTEIAIVIVVNLIISTTITIVLVNSLGKMLINQFYKQFEYVVEKIMSKL